MLALADAIKTPNTCGRACPCSAASKTCNFLTIRRLHHRQLRHQSVCRRSIRPPRRLPCHAPRGFLGTFGVVVSGRSPSSSPVRCCVHGLHRGAPTQNYATEPAALRGDHMRSRGADKPIANSGGPEAYRVNDDSERRPTMGEYLPRVYTDFVERFPEVDDAQGALAKVVRESTPFDERTAHLLKLALAIGAQSDGAVRSNARKGLGHGVTPEELRAVALLSITTCGFPTAIAGLGWIDDVCAAEQPETP